MTTVMNSARLPEGDIFAELFSQACFIAMSSAMLRAAAVREVGAVPPNIQVDSRLLPVRRARAESQSARRPGSCLPVSGASRQHVGISRVSPTTARGTSADHPSVVCMPAAAGGSLPAEEIFHRSGGRRNQEWPDCHGRLAKVIFGRLAGMAAFAPVRDRVARGTAKAAPALLAGYRVSVRSGLRKRGYRRLLPAMILLRNRAAGLHQ